MHPIILGEGGSGSWEGSTDGGLTIAAATDAGFNYKPVNEDRIVIGDDFAAVIDGMGGHSGGARAAQIVAEEIAATPEKIAEALFRSSARMREECYRNVLSGQAGACVMAARVLRGSANALTVQSYQAGDVRRVIARQRQSGNPHFEESDDEGLVDGLLASGCISTEEAKVHPYRNVVSNFISREMCDPGKSESTVTPGDAILLYSDGISGNFSAEAIIRMGVGKKVAELLRAVWEATEEKMKHHKQYPRGDAKADNRSFVAIDVE